MDQSNFPFFAQDAYISGNAFEQPVWEQQLQFTQSNQQYPQVMGALYLQSMNTQGLPGSNMSYKNNNLPYNYTQFPAFDQQYQITSPMVSQQQSFGMNQQYQAAPSKAPQLQQQSFARRPAPTMNQQFQAASPMVAQTQRSMAPQQQQQSFNQASRSTPIMNQQFKAATSMVPPQQPSVTTPTVAQAQRPITPARSQAAKRKSSPSKWIVTDQGRDVLNELSFSEAQRKQIADPRPISVAMPAAQLSVQQVSNNMQAPPAVITQLPIRTVQQCAPETIDLTENDEESLFVPAVIAAPTQAPVQATPKPKYERKSRAQKRPAPGLPLESDEAKKQRHSAIHLSHNTHISGVQKPWMIEQRQRIEEEAKAEEDRKALERENQLNREALHKAENSRAGKAAKKREGKLAQRKAAAAALEQVASPEPATKSSKESASKKTDGKRGPFDTNAKKDAAIAEEASIVASAARTNFKAQQVNLLDLDDEELSAEMKKTGASKSAVEEAPAPKETKKTPAKRGNYKTKAMKAAEAASIAAMEADLEAAFDEDSDADCEAELEAAFEEVMNEDETPATEQVDADDDMDFENDLIAAMEEVNQEEPQTNVVVAAAPQEIEVTVEVPSEVVSLNTTTPVETIVETEVANEDNDNDVKSLFGDDDDMHSLFEDDGEEVVFDETESIQSQETDATTLTSNSELIVAADKEQVAPVEACRCGRVDCAAGVVPSTAAVEAVAPVVIQTQVNSAMVTQSPMDIDTEAEANNDEVVAEAEKDENMLDFEEQTAVPEYDEDEDSEENAKAREDLKGLNVDLKYMMTTLATSKNAIIIKRLNQRIAETQAKIDAIKQRLA